MIRPEEGKQKSSVSKVGQIAAMVQVKRKRNLKKEGNPLKNKDARADRSRQEDGRGCGGLGWLWFAGRGIEGEGSPVKSQRHVKDRIRGSFAKTR